MAAECTILAAFPETLRFPKEREAVGKQLLKRTLAGGHSRAPSSLPVFTLFEVAALVLAFYLFRAFWLVLTTPPGALVPGAARNRPGRFLLLGFCMRESWAGAEPRAARAAEPGLGPTREEARAASGLATRPRVCRAERAPHGGHAPGPALSALPGSPSRAHTLFSRQPCLRRETAAPSPRWPPGARLRPALPWRPPPSTPRGRPGQLAQAQAAGARSPLGGTRPEKRPAEASRPFPLQKLDAVLPQPGRDPTFLYLSVGELLLLLGRPVLLHLHRSRADPGRRARAEGGGGREESVVFPAAAPGDGPRGGTKREAPRRRAARALWRPLRERPFAVGGGHPTGSPGLSAWLEAPTSPPWKEGVCAGTALSGGTLPCKFRVALTSAGLAKATQCL